MPRVLTSSIGVLSALLCALVAALLTPLAAQPAHAADPVRVLLAGDSITQGRHGDYTWRYFLDREFVRQGVPVDLVGSRALPYVDPGYASSSYANAGFDRDHFAFFGLELRNMVNRIEAEVRGQQPDIVVLAAGINDFRHFGSEPDIMDRTTQALRSWIARVREAKPDTRILLSPVLAVDTPMAATLNPQGGQFNTRMRAVAAELTTGQSPIQVATTEQGWQPHGPMAYDGLHPSSTGETFIAQRIAEALRRAGVLPEAPKVYRTVTWPRTVRPTVAVSAGRVTASWEQHAIAAGRIRLQRVGGTAVVARTFSSTGRQALAVAGGASYDVRVQVRRGRMIGPWGPVVRVRVPPALRPPAPARVRVTAKGVVWTAAPRATSYVVKYRKIGTKRWATRRTTALRVYVRRVKVAQVRAVNSGGTSAWRRDVR